MDDLQWVRSVKQEWNKRNRNNMNNKQLLPLSEQTLDENDIVYAIDSLLSGQLSMSNKVEHFEKEFAKYIGAPYAVMVNSGSSANLLALSVAINPARVNLLNTLNPLTPGSEVLVPAICWSTSIAPIIQCGLVPVLVDVEKDNLNISIDDMLNKITKNTKAIILVHVLGNSCDMTKLMDVVKHHSILLIEDTCESLGSTYGCKKLGTFGEFGTYSFFFSHHITTGEGGMVVCHNIEDYNLLRCLRAHGWTRHLTNKDEINSKYSGIDNRFLFVNIGYNLRPMEICGALGICQLYKLDNINMQRNNNYYLLKNTIKTHNLWNNQFKFIKPVEHCNPAWFGFVIILTIGQINNKNNIKNNNIKNDNIKNEYVEYLSSHGIDNRPIVSGNFANQPIMKLYNIKHSAMPNADYISNGLFIGLHNSVMDISKISDILLNYNGFK